MKALGDIDEAIAIERIEEIGIKGDSIGGVVECIVRNMPKGLGMPVFDKLEADLAKGRHDPRVLTRAVPMVEAMVALVLCDR